MNIATILRIVATAKAVTPDFLALASAVKVLLSERDQHELQLAIDAARLRSDALHRDVQAEIARATGKDEA